MRKLYFTPNTEDVELYLNNNIDSKIKNESQYKILHLTPTLILYRKRKQFYRRYFRLLSRKAGESDWTQSFNQHIQVNEFFHWAREAVYKQPNTPLSRNESHVLVKRAISELLPNHREWLSTSYELMELFQQFQTLPIKDDELKDISAFEDWETIINIYEKYLELLKEASLEDFSQALVRIISGTDLLKEYNEVIMDGPFLFFEPIHESVMSRCEQLNIPLSFIVPFDKSEQGEVNPSYRVIQKTYGLYVPENEWVPISGYRCYSSFLERIPRLLFTDERTGYDESISLNRYNSVEQEVFDVVTNIKKKVDQGYTSVNKVAIVTPNSKGLRPLVREISENIGLEVEVPERPFLGMTVGEFLNFIYKIKSDERKYEKDSYLDVSIFKRILSSRWFDQAESTILSFQAIEEVFFDDVTSVLEWRVRFIYLLEIKKELEKEKLPFHPLHYVPVDHIKIWISYLDKVTDLQAFIFSKDEGTISEHSQNLLIALKNMAGEQKQSSYIEEKKVLERIEEIITGINSQDRLKIKPQEFGDLLSSLFLEQEDIPEGTEGGLQDPENKGILVTSLQNIAFQKYNYIYTIQFTQDNYPSAQLSKWPLHNDIQWKLISKTTKLKLTSQYDLERLYTDREKFYFYSSFLSAKIAYGISYSRFEQGLPLSPSHFLNDIAKTFGIEEERKLDPSSKGLKMEELLLKYNILKHESSVEQYEGPEHPNEEEKVEEEPKGDSSLTLDEIAIYKLCPKRYQYMSLYKDRNIYTTPFQLSIYLANELSARVMKRIIEAVKEERLAEEHENKRVLGLLIKMIPQTVNEESGLLKFFPTSNEVKENALYYASMFLESLCQIIVDKGLIQSLAHQGKVRSSISFDLTGKENSIEVHIGSRKYTINGYRDFGVKIDNFPVRTYSLSHRTSFLNSSSYDVEVRSGNKTETYYKWLNRIKREFFYPEHEREITIELGEILKNIENREFKKQKGAHCNYCPFYKICLEKESMVEDIELVEGQEIE